MIAVRDIAWLAGLLEGEGSFGNYRGTPTIQLQMTDGDVVNRAASLMGVKPQAVWGRKDGYLPVHKVVLHGTRAIGWMMTMLAFMGERRRAKIEEVIAWWKASDRMPRAPRGRRFNAVCHPEKLRKGLGLCGACYRKQWLAKQGPEYLREENAKQAVYREKRKAAKVS